MEWKKNPSIQWQREGHEVESRKRMRDAAIAMSSCCSSLLSTKPLFLKPNTKFLGFPKPKSKQSVTEFDPKFCRQLQLLRCASNDKNATSAVDDDDILSLLQVYPLTSPPIFFSLFPSLIHSLPLLLSLVCIWILKKWRYTYMCSYASEFTGFLE